MSVAVTPGVLAVILISQLGSPNYRSRIRAARALRQLTPLVVPYLQAAQNSRDRETSQRSSTILASYYESVADSMAERARPSGWPHLPWLDMLPQDHPDRKSVISYFVKKAQSKIGRKGPPHWADYRMATRLYLRELFMEQRRPKEVRGMLDRMADAEREWIKRNGKKYNPPLKVPQ